MWETKCIVWPFAPLCNIWKTYLPSQQLWHITSMFAQAVNGCSGTGFNVPAGRRAEPGGLSVRGFLSFLTNPFNGLFIQSSYDMLLHSCWVVKEFLLSRGSRFTFSRCIYPKQLPFTNYRGQSPWSSLGFLFSHPVVHIHFMMNSNTGTSKFWMHHKHFNSYIWDSPYQQLHFRYAHLSSNFIYTAHKHSKNWPRPDDWLYLQEFHWMLCLIPTVVQTSRVKKILLSDWPLKAAAELMVDLQQGCTKILIQLNSELNVLVSVFVFEEENSKTDLDTPALQDWIRTSDLQVQALKGESVHIRQTVQGHRLFSFEHFVVFVENWLKYLIKVHGKNICDIAEVSKTKKGLRNLWTNQLAPSAPSFPLRVRWSDEVKVSQSEQHTSRIEALPSPSTKLQNRSSVHTSDSASSQPCLCVYEWCMTSAECTWCACFKGSHEKFVLFWCFYQPVKGPSNAGSFFIFLT